MKLIFSKDATNEIKVKYQNGTIIEDFTYTAMIKQLLLDGNFDESEFGNLTTDEQTKLKQMLQKITEVFKTETSSGNSETPATN